MWLKRSFRLPLPASPSSTNEVETVHPQVVDQALIASDLQLSGKEAFPLFIYLHSLQRITRAKNSGPLARLLREIALAARQSTLYFFEIRLRYLGKENSQSIPRRVSLFAAVLHRERASNISPRFTFLKRLSLIMRFLSSSQRQLNFHFSIAEVERERHERNSTLFHAPK